MHEHLEDLWYYLRQVDLELIYMTISYLSSDNSLITGVMHEHLEDLWYYLRQVDLELIYITISYLSSDNSLINLSHA